MKPNKVLFWLEVMFPVGSTSMTVQDLLRCVGILLDNAIEDVSRKKDAGSTGGAVTLLLLQEDKTLTIVVKKPVQDKPD